MSFNQFNTIVNANTLSSTVDFPIYNANQLQNTAVGDLTNLTNNNILIYNNSNWTFQANYFTGVTGPSDYSNITGATGSSTIGSTGPSDLIGNITGPAGNDATEITGSEGPVYMFVYGPTGPAGEDTIENADTGPTGISNPVIGYTGPTGSDNADDALTGPTGFMGQIIVGYEGYTGLEYLGNSDTGPTGIIGGGLSTDERTGATGPTSYIPSNPLVGIATINNTSISYNTETTLTLSPVYQSSSFYLPVESQTIGVGFGMWKVVVNLNWDAGSGYRKISLVSSDDTVTYATNCTPAATGPSLSNSQQLTYIGNFNNTDVVGATFKIVVSHGNISPINVYGSISVFSFTSIIPDVATGPDGPNTIGDLEFAVRFVNHDTTHPPVKIGIFAGNNLAATTGRYFSTPIVNGRPTAYNTPTISTKVSTLFFNWSDMPMVNGDSNIREIVMGGSGELYVSGHFYISKSDLTADSDLQTWTVSDNANVGGVPQPYLLSLSASELTLDFVEFTFNKPQDIYTLFINQTLVDGMTIPMTLTLLYKNTGNRRLTNGPVGLSKSMNTIFNEYFPAATGTDNPFWRTIKPDYTNPARLITPQKLDTDDLNAFQGYMNDYINTVFWPAWLDPARQVFYPQGPTGAGDSWTHAELYTQGDFTTTGQLFVTPLGGSSSGADAFIIDASDIYNKSIDLMGASGVWITGNSTQQAVKAVLAAALVRGVAQYSGELFTTNSYQSNVSYAQSNWNGYRDAGASFYKNIKPHVYGKVLHDQADINSIDGLSLPYTYAISYDDVYGYSSTITTAQIGTSPSTITQALRANIDIYENDNY